MDMALGPCVAGAFSSEVDAGSREETRQNKNLEQDRS
jgi:hypothetical protein